MIEHFYIVYMIGQEPDIKVRNSIEDVKKFVNNIINVHDDFELIAVIKGEKLSTNIKKIVSFNLDKEPEFEAIGTEEKIDENRKKQEQQILTKTIASSESKNDIDFDDLEPEIDENDDDEQIQDLSHLAVPEPDPHAIINSSNRSVNIKKSNIRKSLRFS